MQRHRSMKLHGILRKLGLHRVGLGFDHHREVLGPGQEGFVKEALACEWHIWESSQKKNKGGYPVLRSLNFILRVKGNQTVEGSLLDD